MARPPLIAVAGHARAGKDTVSNFIVAELGGYRYAFADPIRAMLKPLGIDMSDPYWSSKKEDVIPALGVSPRQMMQTLGTEWGRNLVNTDIWLVMANRRLLMSGPGMVISDLRFENEADWVRSHFGLIIHVLRPDAEAVNKHVSENGVCIDSNDLVIHNTGSLVDLHNKVKDITDVFKA